MLRYLIQRAALALSMLMPVAQAADAVPAGIVEQPCPPTVAMPASVRSLLSELFMQPRTLGADDMQRLVQSPEFVAYNTATRGLGAQQDWANLCRFSAANAEVIQRDQQPQVVFMGDSITENWLLGDSTLFDDVHVNRGIGGQTTPQMLLRFRADVIALRPQAVHLMAGTNDIAGNTGPSTLQDVKNNLMSMVELARAHGIKVLLGSIPPAAAFSWRPDIDPRPFIAELNQWLHDYAAAEGLVYIDYHTPLATADGALRPELGNDGVHPNQAGYAVMRSVLDAQLAELF